MRDEETTLDPDLEWGRGCRGELMGRFGRGLLGWAVARSPRGATSRYLAFTFSLVGRGQSPAAGLPRRPKL